ncbi:MAG: hypothetical protein HEQ32_07565 [Vampirovibrio sp.]
MNICTRLSSWMPFAHHTSPLFSVATEEANVAAFMVKDTKILKIVANQDIYHQQRPILLVKEGQVILPKMAESLMLQGIPLLETCLVEDEEGQQRPLETEDLQSILAKLNSNKIQLDASNNIVSVERNGKATTHTNDLRPVKVMIVAHNKKHQERIRSFLEDEGVFAQHIHPIVQASTLKFMYEKYKPNCLILDVLTHQMFLNAGINTLDLVHQDPSSTLKHTILLTQASMPSGLMSQLLKLKETLEVPYPLTKIDLETTCLPVLKSLQGTFSAAVKLPSKG